MESFTITEPCSTENIENNNLGTVNYFSQGFKNKLINADCFDIFPQIPDNSIDLILCDPPYFKVKKDTWDRQWDKPEGFLYWLDSMAKEWQRILKPNGSVYCFASPKMSARVEVKLSERFNIVNRITWAKPCPF